MSFVISSVVPFPGINWWLHVCNAGGVVFDVAEHFEKMSYRNRYHIAGGNGLTRLSIPLAKGRDQKAAMRDLLISERERWQMQHWRTLFSAYNRSPFFEYYADSLQELFEGRYGQLIDFNFSTIRWVKKQIRMDFGEEITDVYVKDYGDSRTDLRGVKPANEMQQDWHYEQYYQVFEDRNGFLPHLSILDVLFSEGPQTLGWLKRNAGR